MQIDSPMVDPEYCGSPSDSAVSGDDQQRTGSSSLQALLHYYSPISMFMASGEQMLLSIDLK